METTEVGFFPYTVSLFFSLMVLTSSLSGDTLQFVNRQFLQDGAYSSGEKEQRDEWTPETEVGTFSSDDDCG